jgi:hypothetical protein
MRSSGSYMDGRPQTNSPMGRRRRAAARVAFLRSHKGHRALQDRTWRLWSSCKRLGLLASRATSTRTADCFINYAPERCRRLLLASLDLTVDAAGDKNAAVVSKKLLRPRLGQATGCFPLDARTAVDAGEGQANVSFRQLPYGDLLNEACGSSLYGGPSSSVSNRAGRAADRMASIGALSIRSQPLELRPLALSASHEPYIEQGIVVYAYTSEERTIGWCYYLGGTFALPLEAKYSRE